MLEQPDEGLLESPDIRVGDLPGELRVFDHGFVRLDASMADDLSVVNGARVSFAVRKEVMEERDAGLIRFLMRERHGCFDDATDVLTDEGWKPWPRVTGEERFATLSLAGTLEYQPALRVIHKDYKGPMIGFKGMCIDKLVTPDHRVLASRMTTLPRRRSPVFSLTPARDVLWVTHRHLTTASWHGTRVDRFALGGDVTVSAEPWLRLVGFFIGDGHAPAANNIQFHLRKHREIGFLHHVAQELGLRVRSTAENYYIPLSSVMRDFFELCYGADREKLIPRQLLELDAELLGALLEGLMESDGSRQVRPGRGDRVSYHTTSRPLADQVQELALKVGRCASVRPHAITPGDGHYGTKDRWRVVIFNPRNSQPALCRTRAEADNHMDVTDYDGGVHCVTVPNGTLYVRRNGYPVFSGNSPFEHNAFRFHIRTPIFVAREWFRHRVGSFNEESARYHMLEGDFYVPTARAVRKQVGKPGSYSYEPTEEAVATDTIATFERIYGELYREYQRLIDGGVAKELARALLPFGIYTQFFWTLNARSLMNFVSLRNSPNAQFEIRTYAQAVERLFAEKMPVTHECFLEFGRKVP